MCRKLYFIPLTLDKLIISAQFLALTFIYIHNIYNVVALHNAYILGGKFPYLLTDFVIYEVPLFIAFYVHYRA